MPTWIEGHGRLNPALTRQMLLRRCKNASGPPPILVTKSLPLTTCARALPRSRRPCPPGKDVAQGPLLPINGVYLQFAAGTAIGINNDVRRASDDCQAYVAVDQAGVRSFPEQRTVFVESKQALVAGIGGMCQQYAIIRQRNNVSALYRAGRQCFDHFGRIHPVLPSVYTFHRVNPEHITGSRQFAADGGDDPGLSAPRSASTRAAVCHCRQKQRVIMQYPVKQPPFTRLPPQQIAFGRKAAISVRHTASTPAICQRQQVGTPDFPKSAVQAGVVFSVAVRTH